MKRNRRFVAIFIGLALLVTTFSMTASAAATRVKVTGKTDLTFANASVDKQVIAEQVDKNGIDMSIDPKQDLDNYLHTGCVRWQVEVDLNKVPYLYVDLADNETAYCMVILIQNATGANIDSKTYPYILAGNSGMQKYDLKTDLGEQGYNGTVNLELCALVDDGMTAGGQVNYIRSAYFDTVNVTSTVSSAPKTSSVAATSSAPATSTTGTSSVASESNSTDVSSIISEVSENSIDSAADSSDTATTGAEEKSGKLWPFIIIGVVLVIAAGGVATFIIIKKRSV